MWGVQERERDFNSATPLSPVTDQKKREREKKDPNSLMELFQTHYISQLFCGLNYDDITGQLQMQKTHISDLIFQCGPS